MDGVSATCSKFQIFIDAKSLPDVPTGSVWGCLLQVRHSAPVQRDFSFTFSCVIAFSSCKRDKIFSLTL